MKDSEPLSEDKTAEQIFEHHFEKMRHGLFRSSLNHYIETSKLSGSMLLEVRAMFNSYASQFNIPEPDSQTFSIEDMKAAFDAGEVHEFMRHFGSLDKLKETSFDEWIATRKPIIPDIGK